MLTNIYVFLINASGEKLIGVYELNAIIKFLFLTLIIIYKLNRMMKLITFNFVEDWLKFTA